MIRLGTSRLTNEVFMDQNNANTGNTFSIPSACGLLPDDFSNGSTTLSSTFDMMFLSNLGQTTTLSIAVTVSNLANNSGGISPVSPSSSYSYTFGSIASASISSVFAHATSPESLVIAGYSKNRFINTQEPLLNIGYSARNGKFKISPWYFDTWPRGNDHDMIVERPDTVNGGNMTVARTTPAVRSEKDITEPLLDSGLWKIFTSDSTSSSSSPDDEEEVLLSAANAGMQLRGVDYRTCQAVSIPLNVQFSSITDKLRKSADTFSVPLLPNEDIPTSCLQNNDVWAPISSSIGTVSDATTPPPPVPEVFEFSGPNKEVEGKTNVLTMVPGTPDMEIDPIAYRGRKLSVADQGHVAVGKAVFLEAEVFIPASWDPTTNPADPNDPSTWRSFELGLQLGWTSEPHDPVDGSPADNTGSVSASMWKLTLAQCSSADINIQDEACMYTLGVGFNNFEDGLLSEIDVHTRVYHSAPATRITPQDSSGIMYRHDMPHWDYRWVDQSRSGVLRSRKSNYADAIKFGTWNKVAIYYSRATIPESGEQYYIDGARSYYNTPDLQFKASDRAFRCNAVFEVFFNGKAVQRFGLMGISHDEPYTKMSLQNPSRICRQECHSYNDITGPTRCFAHPSPDVLRDIIVRGTGSDAIHISNIKLHGVAASPPATYTRTCDAPTLTAESKSTGQLVLKAIKDPVATVNGGGISAVAVPLTTNVGGASSSSTLRPIFGSSDSSSSTVTLSGLVSNTSYNLYMEASSSISNSDGDGYYLSSWSLLSQHAYFSRLGISNSTIIDDTSALPGVPLAPQYSYDFVVEVTDDRSLMIVLMHCHRMSWALLSLLDQSYRQILLNNNNKEKE
jgi:hypothetical protein